MTAPLGRHENEAIRRARESGGSSAVTIHRLAATLLHEMRVHRGTIVDLGCGRGDLHRVIGTTFNRFVGVDIVRYEELPNGVHFVEGNLNVPVLALEDGSADVVTAIETIEHLENPRAFLREMCRIVRPGGHLLLTTPNQLSLLSKLTLVFKNEFNAFQERPGLYPGHLTALLEVDLLRMADELGLEDIRVRYTERGRVPLTGSMFPRWANRLFPRALSDNVLLTARSP